MSDDELLDRIAQAIGDPGSILPRHDRRTGHDNAETIVRWSARAVVQVLSGLVPVTPTGVTTLATVLDAPAAAPERPVFIPHLTPTRRTLLQEVADGNVVRSNGIGNRLYDHYRPGYGGGIGRRLSVRVTELKSAGWIRFTETPPTAVWDPGGRGTWELTDAGRAVLGGAS